ncbi:MAG: alpha-glucosidase [Oscillospiraceae bacterium]|nr:alpha-glucosidase [Oscillospiraceae bacterium]
MQIIRNGMEFVLKKGEHTILEHTKANPMIYVGYGKETVDMYRGNFKIEDYVIERRPVEITSIEETAEGLTVEMGDALTMAVKQDGECVTLNFVQKDEQINRFWLRVRADKDEHCYGCGEQMSYFDLRGRHFPLWTGEPGVGRDKTTYVTWRSDVENGGAGGDYYNTNYPQPTFVSSKRYYVDVDCTAYADFDFRDETFHELQMWAVPASVRIEGADTFVELLEKLTAHLGRQPELPDWIYNGLIVGVQGGNERSFGLVDKSIENGIKVAAVWCQDWCGKRVTSFGKRLQWDWHFHEEMYPDLPGEIQKLHDRGIRFMGYINPYLVQGGKLYQEGLEKDVFAKKADGSIYLVDFGEFYCGVIDFTKPEAYEWFKDEVIKKHSIDIGIDGWMADFGEYLPTDDIVLHNGVSAMIEHNHWPALWAKCNYDAVNESGKLGDVVYFMRAGATGSQKYCTLLWNGDQSVDLSRHDGLCTTICGTLSAGMIGCGLNHSDIGGYTSLFDNLRTKEVFLRWTEMAAFTPVMRTHEGNRPDTNFQYYDDADCMAETARLVDIHVMLMPYLKELVAENAARGIPVQRPLFLHNEADERSYTEQFEYLLGEDVLVAPVWQEAQTDREVYLPSDGWIHLWSGAEYGHGTCTVPAPIGSVPVFYKKGSKVAGLMEQIRAKHGK